MATGPKRALAWEITQAVRPPTQASASITSFLHFFSSRLPPPVPLSIPATSPSMTMKPKQRTAYDKAREEILDAVERTRRGDPVTKLNFDRWGLWALPPEIGQLTALEDLRLGENHLT